MPNDVISAESSSELSSTDESDVQVKPWTVMVYMAGNNNLSENMAFSLESLHEFGGNLSPDDRSKVNLLAYFDGSSLTAPTHYIDYSDLGPTREPHREPVTIKHIYHQSGARADSAATAAGSGHSPINDNSASAYSIMNFVRWCIVDRKRRAQNYAVIFSGHSFGFHGTSFMRDDSAGTHLTLFKFRWALDELNKGYLKGQNNDKIAILGFDSCVMSMLEIGFELKDVAQTLVASEGSLPNSGWGYAPMLREFLTAYQKEAEAAPAEKASLLAPEYVKNAATKFVVAFTDQQRRLALGGRSIDISSWDLENVDDLAKAVNELGAFLDKNLQLEPDNVTNEKLYLRQEMKKVVLQSQYDAQSYMKDQCVDLRDFCQRLSFESKFLHAGPFSSPFQHLSELCEKVIDSVDNCVLKCGYSGDEYQFSNGISVFFPWSHLAFSIAAYKYRYLWFNRGEGSPDKPSGVGKDWVGFVSNYVWLVTRRESRKTKAGEIRSLESSLKDNPPWSRDNPPWSKDNPPWSKDNPPWSRDNPPWSRDNPPWSRDNPPWSKGEGGDSLFYFSRFKNFEMIWDISGFSDERLRADEGGSENA